MNVKRYIIVQAVQTDNHELIPVWDERLTYTKSEMFGEGFEIKDEYQKTNRVVECVYDLKKRTLSMGIELDYYPEEKDVEYKKGEEVYYETSHRKLKESKIKDIVFEDFDVTIVKGKKMDGWCKKHFTDLVIDPNAIYAIKNWKPYYILENDVKIEWTHQLYKKSI